MSPKGKNPMATNNEPAQKAEAVEPQRKAAGRSRVKPRHLSQVLRQCIVDQFRACHSTEDIAEALGIPARTVADVLIAEALRKPLQPERGLNLPALLRRTA